MDHQRRAMPPPPLPQDSSHLLQDEPLSDKYKKLKRRYQDMENSFNAMSLELHRAGEQNRRLSREKDMLLDRIIELQSSTSPPPPRSRSPVSTLGTPRHSPGPIRRHPDQYQPYTQRHPHPNQLPSQPRTTSRHPLTPAHDAALQRVLDEDSEDEQLSAFRGRRNPGGPTISNVEFPEHHQQLNGAATNGSRDYSASDRERYPYPAPAPGPSNASPPVNPAYPPPATSPYSRYRHTGPESAPTYYTPYAPPGQAHNDGINERSPPPGRTMTPTPGFAPAQFPSPSPPPHHHEYTPGPPVHGNGAPHQREKRGRGGDADEEATRKRARMAPAPDALVLSPPRTRHEHEQQQAQERAPPSTIHTPSQHPSLSIKRATPSPPMLPIGIRAVMPLHRNVIRARGRGRGASAASDGPAAGRRKRGKKAKDAEPGEGTIIMSNGVVIARDQAEAEVEHPRGGGASTSSVAPMDHTAAEAISPPKLNGSAHANAHSHPHPNALPHPEPKDVDPPIPPPSLPPSIAARGGSTPPRPMYSPAPPAPPPSGPPPRDRSHLPPAPPPPLVPPRPRSTKPKRLKAHTVQSRSFSIPCVPRTADGQPQLPLNVGIMTVRSLGQVCLEKHFHTERYIFPIGYEVTRRYLSMHHPEVEAQYTCTILRGEDIDGGSGPRFRITPSDDVDNPITAGTATGAWSVIVKAANKVRNRQHSNSVSGPDYFGLGQNTIKHLLQELKDADLLQDYVRQKFVEGGPLGGRHAAVTAAVTVDEKTGEAPTSDKFSGGTSSKPSSPVQEPDEDEDEDAAAMGAEPEPDVGNMSFVRGSPSDSGRSLPPHDVREREGHQLPSLPSIDSFTQHPPVSSSSHSRSPTVSLAGHRSPPPLHVGPSHAQRYSPGPTQGMPSGLKGLMNPYGYAPPPLSHRRQPSPSEYGHHRHSPGPPEYHRPDYEYREHGRSPPSHTHGSPAYSNGSLGHT